MTRYAAFLIIVTFALYGFVNVFAPWVFAPCRVGYISVNLLGSGWNCIAGYKPEKKP